MDLLVFFHRVLKKVPKETMTFELRPQRDGGASHGDTWGRGTCFRQKELSVQRSCADGKLVCSRRGGGQQAGAK